MTHQGGGIDARRLAALTALEKKVLWLAMWTIHHANHVRPKADGLKVGGHQASSASLVTLMTALYFDILRPRDRVAVKPHASPVFHAIQYLLGNQSREALERFRAYGGAQSYPSRTKDADDVDFSTGSVGLGVAMTAFASLVQDYLRGHGWGGGRPEGRMVALAGDAELDEGNIFEALQEGYKHGLRNCWWVIDYNRQSLDSVVYEQMHGPYTELFRSFGWDVVILKYGRELREAFRRPGGEALREWIDACPNMLYSALTFQGGPAWRARLEADLGRETAAKIIGNRGDDDLARLMTNLGGHDLPSILEAFRGIDHDRPVCVLAYTIKGFGTPLAGHKDNHAGLMTPEQMEGFRQTHNVRPGHEWDPFEGLEDPEGLEAFLRDVPFNAEGPRRYTAPAIPVPKRLEAPKDRVISTQAGFGKILDGIARAGGPLADRIVTTSPDVTVSTGLASWVNKRALFAREPQEDIFRAERVASLQKWTMKPDGQHIELGIAENNFFTLLAALGLSHSLFGERLLPVGALYDPFIQRGLDALNYGCYQDARFLLAGTPSGISLAPEGGAHQSIGTPLIGAAQDGLASFEPAFVDELAVIMRWAFDYMQRDGETGLDAGDWLRDRRGGSVYLRLSTKPVEQPLRELDEATAGAIIDGGYWLRPPGPNCDLVVVAMGAMVPEAAAAVGRMAEHARDIGLLVATSPDRLYAGWQAAQRAREDGIAQAQSHVERLLAPVPQHAALVTVADAYPLALGWLGSVFGHRLRSLGVEHFGQSGSQPELYAKYGLDVEAIVTACAAIRTGRPLRVVKGGG